MKTRLNNLGVNSTLFAEFSVRGKEGSYTFIFEDISPVRDGSRVVATVFNSAGIAIKDMVITNTYHGCASLMVIVTAHGIIDDKWFDANGWSNPRSEKSFYDHFILFGEEFYPE